MISIPQDIQTKLDRLHYLNNIGEADEDAVSDEMMDTIRVLRTELAAEFLPVIQELIAVGMLTAALGETVDRPPANRFGAFDVVEASADATIWVMLGCAMGLEEE